MLQDDTRSDMLIDGVSSLDSAGATDLTSWQIPNILLCSQIQLLGLLFYQLKILNIAG